MSEVCSGEQRFAQLRTGFKVWTDGVQGGFLVKKKGKVIFHAEGPKTEKEQGTNSKKFGTRNLESESETLVKSEPA